MHLKWPHCQVLQAHRQIDILALFQMSRRDKQRLVDLKTSEEYQERWGFANVLLYFMDSFQGLTYQKVWLIWAVILICDLIIKIQLEGS